MWLFSRWLTPVPYWRKFRPMGWLLRYSVMAVLAAVFAVSGAPAGASKLSLPLRASDSATAPVAGSVDLYSASHALVIGNDAYTGAWPRLSNAVEDARLVAEALIAKGFNVTFKTNLNARDLEEAFEEFFLVTGGDPDARLFVWYAGHGYSEAGEGYLVPIDAPDASEGGRFLLKALSLRRMGEYARGAKALHILSVFDSCFAGTVFNVGRAKPPAAITRATTRPVRQFLTSGDAGQEVSDDGAFRKLFVRAINGDTAADANKDGFLSASELGLFMTNQITNYTNGRQTPRNGKLNDLDLNQGDFIFQLAAVPSEPKSVKTAPLQTPAPVFQAPAIDKEVVFWNAIKDSKSAAAYEAYLRQYPDGAFAELAKVRAAELKAARVAALTPPKRTYPLDEVSKSFIARRNANVREEPDAGSPKTGLVRKGTEVFVSGKVTGKDWFVVERDGKRLGYVFASLLQDKEDYLKAQRDEARRQAEIARREREKKAARMPPPKTYTPPKKSASIPPAKVDPFVTPPKGHQRRDYDNGAYVGQIYNNTRHGYGVYAYKSGNRYEGQWKNGDKHGYGVFTWSTGSKYSGGYKNGEREGYGVYTNPKGSSYKGRYYKGYPNGQGTYISQSGKVYKGTWRNGCFEESPGGRWATVHTTKEKCGFK